MFIIFLYKLTPFTRFSPVNCVFSIDIDPTVLKWRGKCNYFSTLPSNEKKTLEKPLLFWRKDGGQEKMFEFIKYPHLFVILIKAFSFIQHSKKERKGRMKDRKKERKIVRKREKEKESLSNE